MACYNFTKRADRDRCRADRQAEVDAVREGRWPRSIDDSMRWLYPPTNPYLSATHNQDIAAQYAAKMCQSEIDYLNGVEARIAQGDPDVANWEK